MPIRKYLVARLQEASTYRGVVLVLAAVGIKLTPDATQSILTLGVGVAGLIGALLPDSKKSLADAQAEAEAEERAELDRLLEKYRQKPDNQFPQLPPNAPAGMTEVSQ